jgi:Sulfite exporter TauE/SafE
MIGALSFISRGDIQHVVALKNFLTLCMRGTAILVLVIEGNVNWNYGVLMAVGGLIGGYLGGNDIASLEPYSCSLHRYRDRFCRVSLLLLEVIRTGRGAGRGRTNGRADFEHPMITTVAETWQL